VYYDSGVCDASLQVQCFQVDDHKHTFMATNVTKSATDKYDPGHYLLLPGSKTAKWAVIGVEDRKVLSRKLEKNWDLAWRLAFKPYELISPSLPFNSVPFLPPMRSLLDASSGADASLIGIGLNPASAHSMHQMHIHVARLPNPMRQLLRGRDGTFGTWTKVILPITNPDKSKIKVLPTGYVRYFSLSMTKAGPSMYRIFHQAFAFAGRSWMYLQAWGIMIIPDEASIDLSNPNAPPPWVLLGAFLQQQLGFVEPFQGYGPGKRVVRAREPALHELVLWKGKFLVSW
jgi:hypothetical protein